MTSETSTAHEAPPSSERLECSSASDSCAIDISLTARAMSVGGGGRLGPPPSPPAGLLFAKFATTSWAGVGGTRPASSGRLPSTTAGFNALRSSLTLLPRLGFAPPSFSGVTPSLSGVTPAGARNAGEAGESVRMLAPGWKTAQRRRRRDSHLRSSTGCAIFQISKRKCKILVNYKTSKMH